MSWFKRYLTASRMMSVNQALEILGISPSELIGKHADEVQAIVKRKRKELALKWHPDRVQGGDVRDFNKKMQDINNAVDAIALAGWHIGTPNEPRATYRHAPSWGDRPRRNRSYEEEIRDQFRKKPYPWESVAEFQQRRKREQEEDIGVWETDQYARSFNVGQSRRDINYCKKEIYDYSIRFGRVQNMTLVAFDGAFFRSMFTARTNPQGAKFAAEVMAEWNATSGNPYESEAVFEVEKDYMRHSVDQTLKLVWLHGRLLDQPVKFVFEKDEERPWASYMTDHRFIEQIRDYVRTH